MTRRSVQSSRVLLGGANEPLRIVPARIDMVDGRITAVVVLDAEPTEPSSTESASVPVDDYGDKLIAPAFVNAHTHLSLGFLRGYDMRAASEGNMVEEFFFEIERRLSPSDVRAFARIFRSVPLSSKTVRYR